MPNFQSYLFDARPDRLDLRDREYRPPLKTLPSQFPTKKQLETFLPCYKQSKLILDQGKEGACTGFGLAATINYLHWRDEIAALTLNDQTAEPACVEIEPVSELMLYQMAKIYDEWEGEDYTGSSCRGAMKGWHRHGVCTKSKWNYSDDGRFASPKAGWEKEALEVTLGAYYRIKRDSVVDMQSAIVECGAIYCSADVHKGWFIQKTKTLPVIRQNSQIEGGHAFCIIGYNQQGFIVQNSWGDTWGWNGFALLTYADWIANGSDAWVVARGVPISAETTPTMYSHSSLIQTYSNSPVSITHSDRRNKFRGRVPDYVYDPKDPTFPFTPDTAQKHTLIVGNNGAPRLTTIEAENGEASARYIAFDYVKKWLDESSKHKKIVIYAHGGLTSEEAAMDKVRLMGPCFKANDIYPLFIVWRSGLLETMKNILSEATKKVFGRSDQPFSPVEGLGERISDLTDATLEAALRTIHAKGFWSEMKENAMAASDYAIPGTPQNRAGRKGAMVLLAQALKDLSTEMESRNIEIHVVGHSAGAILLGSWLKVLKKEGIELTTASLFAPACSLDFANNTWAKAFDDGTLPKTGFYLHNMDEEMEKSDTTTPLYRKSLLYLVSRALESIHKIPLLGLDEALNSNRYKRGTGGFNESQKSALKKWLVASTGCNQTKIYKHGHVVRTHIDGGTIPLSHGSFDNDIDVVEHTIKKIRRSSTLKARVSNLV